MRLTKDLTKGQRHLLIHESVVGKTKSDADRNRKRTILKIRLKKLLADRHFILIIDEAHSNDTDKAKEIISKFKADKTVRVSATIEDPKIPDKVEFYEVTEEEVIASGLITKSVVVNEGLENYLGESQDISAEFEMLLKARNKSVRKLFRVMLNMGGQASIH